MEHLDFEAEKEQISQILHVIDDKIRQLRVKIDKQNKLAEENQARASMKSIGLVIDPSSLDHVKMACTSCDSLNQCNICSGIEHVSASALIECIKSIQATPLQEPQSSSDSLANCVECKKSFLQSNQSIGNVLSEDTLKKNCSCATFVTCMLCKNSKTSIKTNRGKSVVETTAPSSSSLTCRLIGQNQCVSNESHDVVNQESLAAIKCSHSKFPSCSSSLNVCSFCQIKLTKGVPHFKAVTKQDRVKDTSQFQPVADIIQSIYYSQTRVTQSESTTKAKSSTKEKKTAENDTISQNQRVQQQQQSQDLEEISRKPLQIKKRIEKYQDHSCDLKDEEAVTDESPSQIIEQRRLERLKQEQEKRKRQEMEAAKIYEKFLTKQREEMITSGAIEESVCEDEGEKVECGFLDDCVPDPEIIEHEPVDISKKFLVMKYEIEMQNYKISKLCQELKAKTRKGTAPLQLAKIKNEIKKEIKKLKSMIEYTMRAQKENPNEMWGSIPISSVSFTQLERQSYKFEKAEMPEKPSNFSLTASFLSEAERYNADKEKIKLIKQLELNIEKKRIQCLSEKSQCMKNDIFFLKKKNDELKQKQKFYESEREDFKPDEKLQEVQQTMVDLMAHIKNLKKEFDDIHLKLHEIKK